MHLRACVHCRAVGVCVSVLQHACVCGNTRMYVATHVLAARGTHEARRSHYAFVFAAMLSLTCGTSHTSTS